MQRFLKKDPEFGNELTSPSTTRDMERRGAINGPSHAYKIINPNRRSTSDIIPSDPAVNYAQHGFEFRNPYERLVAKLGKGDKDRLPIIVIKAFGTKPPGSELSPLLKTGLITANDKTLHASLPFEFVVAAAQIAAELGGPDAILATRVTVWSQDTVPNAPKPSSIKLKTGKGGISGGVIPVDISTTTNEGPNGKLIALKQNEKDIPDAKEEKITTVQWAKPLEQVLAGLNKTPPDFVISAACTDEKIKEQGYIEFRMNCSDSPSINTALYRIDLCQNNRGENSKAPQQPLVTPMSRPVS